MKYLSKALSSLSAVLFLSLTIIACGGGGGNSTPPEPSDSTPDSFTFVEVTEAELSSVVESESITITGIDTATSVSISGGEYSIDGGSFISSSGSVTNGQSVIVRQTVSSEHSTTTDTVLTIGGVSGTFRVTTLAADTSPDIVFFNVRNNVEPNMPIESNDITVSGISVPVAISINNGEYAIDGGIYTSDAGMIENGQSVVVRLTASSELETTTSAILSIGDIESAFEVTTKGRFNFEGFTGVALDARLQTRIVAINNIGDQTPISIENGEYQLDRGAWTDQDGFIDNDQEVRVRTHSGDDYNVTTAAKLNIGESWGYFEITTKEHGDFISVWQTQIDPPSGSHNDQITLPLEANGTYNFTVEWGDGTSDIITQWDQVEVTHTYPQAGEYTVTIRGEIIGFSFNNSGDKEKLLEVRHWGDLRLGNSGGYFAGAKYLNISAEDALDLEGTTSLEYLFYITENVQGNISNWDVSSVTDMSWMFRYASGFNGDISQWDVSSVVNMNVMFSNAFVFNGDISQWDVSSVTAMNNMFAVALAFNGDLSQWDVSSVKEMGAMFYSAPVFNSDISQWDVSSVTDMSYMFSVAKAFNGDLSQWDVSSVTKMSYMFEAASVFNSDLSQWNVSSVTDMYKMFHYASAFNSDLSQWNVSSVTGMGMTEMFYNAIAFNSDLSQWNVSSVTNMRSMFSGARAFNSDLSQWDVSSVTNMRSMFADATAFNGDLSQWDVSSVISMEFMFYKASVFNSDISQWDVSSVTDMNSMLFNATAFNGALSKWDVSSVVGMYRMFDNTNLSTENYSATLNGWSQLTGLQENVTLGASGINYNASASVARNFLINDKGWSITDAGEEPTR